MKNWYSSYSLHCHWCNKLYRAKKSGDHARFCSAAHKQAHYRAYKKWVTDKSHVGPGAGRKPVTQKKTKKKQKC